MCAPTVIAPNLQIPSQGLQGISWTHSMTATRPFRMRSSDGIPGHAASSAAEALGLLSEEEASAKKNEIRERLNSLRSGLFGEKRRTAKNDLLKDMKIWQHENGREQTWKA